MRRCRNKSLDLSLKKFLHMSQISSRQTSLVFKKSSRVKAQSSKMFFNAAFKQFEVHTKFTKNTLSCKGQCSFFYTVWLAQVTHLVLLLHTDQLHHQKFFTSAIVGLKSQDRFYVVKFNTNTLRISSSALSVIIFNVLRALTLITRFCEVYI